MPIMNGYEACKQIESYLDKSKNLFACNNDVAPPHKRKSSNSELMEFARDIDNHPIMIAYSGLVNSDIKKKCLAAGFQLVIENPVTVQKI